jgi:hypothetical protein
MAHFGAQGGMPVGFTNQGIMSEKTRYAHYLQGL